MSLFRRWLVVLLSAAAVAGQGAGERGAPGARLKGGDRRASRTKGEVGTPPPPAFVDAVLYGSDGKPVRGLSATDFSLLVNGAPKKVTAANYIDAEAGALSPSSTVIALKPDQIHRTLVFVADDLSFSAEDAQRVRDALTRFVDERMFDRDMVSIVRTESGSGAAQQLTGDRRPLQAAITAIHDNAGREASAACAAGARAAFRGVLAGLNGVPGRKAVIVFSANGKLLDEPVEDGIRDAANRATAVISTVDLRGRAASAGFSLLAESTSGTAVAATGDLLSAIGPILADQQGYYLVSYETGEPETDLFTGRPLPRSVELSCTRPGVTIQSRHGAANGEDFVSTVAERDFWRPSFTTPISDLHRALTNPFAGSGMQVQLSVTYNPTKNFGQAEGAVFIDPRSLTFTKLLDGRITGALGIQIAAFDETGHGVQAPPAEYPIQLKPGELQKVIETGFRATVSLPLRNPGSYQVRVAVRDGASGRVGSSAQFLAAPDVSSGQLTICGVALAASEAPKTNAPLTRRFHPGETFRYSYQVVNLRADEGRRSSMEVQTRILHDGRAVFEGKETLLAFGPAEDPTRRGAGAEVRLGAALEPGYYALQIVVTDKGAKETRRATEFASFEVR